MTLAERLQQSIIHDVPFRGETIKLRLAPLDLWIRQGKVPTFFQEQYLKTTGGSKDVRAVDADEAQQNGADELAFREQVVRYCLVDPAITPEGQPSKDGELTIEQVQLIPGLYELVYGFGIFRGSQAILNTKGGQIKADDLATFRDEPEQPAGARAHGGAIQSEAISAVGTAG